MIQTEGKRSPRREEGYLWETPRLYMFVSYHIHTCCSCPSSLHELKGRRIQKCPAENKKKNKTKKEQFGIETFGDSGSVSAVMHGIVKMKQTENVLTYEWIILTGFMNWIKRFIEKIQLRWMIPPRIGTMLFLSYHMTSEDRSIAHNSYMDHF